MTEPLWQPDRERMARSNMSGFIQYVDAKAETSITDYDALYEYSVTEIEAFWEQFWDYAEIVGDMGARPRLLDADRMPGARFFPEAKLNYAENLLVRNDETTALVFWGEDRVRRTTSWAELTRMAARAQGFFRERGVGAGDRVAAMMPNMPETIMAKLGAAADGVVWSSCSPDFGVQGVLDRFGQIEPRVLIACDSYFYNGKTFSIADKLEQIVAGMPSLETVVIVTYGGGAEDIVASLDKAVPWENAVAARSEETPAFTRFGFDHPLAILFSSGTTGAPKCIVHGAGGTLLQHVKEQRLHFDLGQGQRLFYFTTCGWMMWNWVVSGLASGATLMLYDGSPFHPSGSVLFDYAQAERFDLFGTSAKYIDALKKGEYVPRETHDLSSVRTIGSTGSVLVPESFDYVYESIKHDVHLASVSGGTDIMSCFVLGNPLKPVWRGEIQSPGLGMAVDVYDEAGAPLAEGKGELVCTRPFPSMPIGFWNDPEGRKYHGAYFDRFPGIWHHGDFAEKTEHGGYVIHGRSDATLNPGGVRIGTAEIYRQVEQLDEIMESIVIGQDWDGDVRIVLFVVLRDGCNLDDDLRGRITRQIRAGASPRHVPARIVQVADIPRTKSGKITELAVRDIIHGREIKNKEALANPEALELFEGIEELGR